MTATVTQIKRAGGKGRQPAHVELARDLQDDLTAHHAEALDFVRIAKPVARQLELALEAIAARDEQSSPLWRHLLNRVGALAYELDRYERRHKPSEPEPDMAVAA